MEPDYTTFEAARPGMDGVAFARALRDEVAVGHVPLIALSAMTTPEMIERGTAAWVQWKAYNQDVLDLGGLGDVAGLLAAMRPIFANSERSASEIDSSP